MGEQSGSKNSRTAEFKERVKSLIMKTFSPAFNFLKIFSLDKTVYHTFYSGQQKNCRLE